MKKLTLAILAMNILNLTIASSYADNHAYNINTGTLTSDKHQVSSARVTDLIKLVDTDIKVNLLVQDLGGSTDISPTQKLYLTIYLKGEMFSTDLSFKIGSVINYGDVKRVKAGLYTFKAMTLSQEGQILNKKYMIDAREATRAVRAVRCEDFDCEASKNLSSKIIVKEMK